jgi:opacity protein-like surface antigen
MKRFARFCPSLAILLLLVAPAFAQTQYRLELFGAGSFPLDKEFIIGLPQYSPPLEGVHEYSNTVRGGIRVGADFRKHWGEDITYSFGRYTTKIVNRTVGNEFAFAVPSHEIAFNALWYPMSLDSKSKALPYVTAGVGTTFFVVGSKDINAAMEAGLGKLESDNVFAFNAGGGVAVRLREHIGVRVDARDFMSPVPRFGIPKSSDDPSALVFPAGGVFHRFEASFAFVYYF